MTKFYWDGKPIEKYTKKELIEILTEILEDMQEVMVDRAKEWIKESMLSPKIRKDDK